LYKVSPGFEPTFLPSAVRFEQAKIYCGVHGVSCGTDDLETLYKDLLAKGVKIDVPSHDEPWERSMTAFDPDGYSVEFSQGQRGRPQNV
jgi:Glyoxalase/Bleomycin resistance protein/Dioxygenase superfamily